VTPPFVGQGLVAGLRDAANLGWKLAWVVKGLATREVLESYDRERRPHAKQMIDLARSMGFFVAPSSRLGSLCVHIGLRFATAIPLIRRTIDHLNATKPVTRFTAGLFVEGRSSVAPYRGTWLPQGRVRGADDRIQLSDSILGPGLTCIGFGRTPEHYVGANDAAAWRALGGTMVQVCPRGESTLRPGTAAFEDIDDTFAAFLGTGWMLVARPDGVLLHDGPLASASRVLKESLSLLGRAPTAA